MLLFSRIAYRATEGTGRDDLLVPFVAPHVFIVSVILAIAGRSFFSWALFSLLAPHSFRSAAFLFLSDDRLAAVSLSSSCDVGLCDCVRQAD